MIFQSAAIFGALILLLCGCEDNMRYESRIKPLQPSNLFADSRSSRPLMTGTVARGHLDADEAFNTGRKNGVLVQNNPLPISAELLQRGRERFNIYCAVCHGADGYGHGMIVQRGFSPPPSYHSDDLRQQPDGYIVEVITNGRGAMYSYASRVAPRDRWAIAAYIRALQLSQNAAAANLESSERQKLEENAR